MARRPPSDSSPPGSARLLGLLVLSGFAGIALEIAWFRKLHLTLGSESYSVALVLAAFMAGLGLGSFLFGRLADRMPPVVLYRRLELGIGLFGLASPFVLAASSVPYVALRTGLHLEGGALLTAKFALSFLLLLPPTLLMGGTLPAAARALTARFEARGRAFSLAYGFNALGAGIAAIVAPFVLLPRIGLTRTVALAAACNLLVFALARGRSFPVSPDESAARPDARDAGPTTLGWMQVPFFLTGFVALAAETVWNRLFSFFFTSSVYTFSLILAVYLVTLAAGSLCFPLVRRRFRDPGAIFATCQLLIAGTLLVSTMFLDRAPLVLLDLLAASELTFTRFVNASAVTLALFTAPATFLFGLSFPAGVAFATSRMPRLGRDIGRLLLWNTLGTAAASIVVTALLYRALGSRGSLILFAGLMVVSHFVVAHMLGSGRRKLLSLAALAVIVAGGALGEWNLSNFHLRLAQRPQDALAAVRAGRLDEFRAGAEVLAFEDGPAATASIVEVEGLYPSLYINGKPDASENLYDMRTQYLLGALPVLFHGGDPATTRVLVIGLGSGVTTNAVDGAGIADVTTVEISPTVVAMADRYFRKSNEGVLERTRIVVDDGRDFVASTDERFDIIISEPSNPWISGVSNLFTDEFFATAADHLDDGGVFCQWMHYYNTDVEILYGMTATLRARFRDVHVFLLSGDLLFLASNRPLAPDWDRFARPPERVRRMLDTIGYPEPSEVLRHYLWSPDVVRGLRTSYPPNTDDRPWLEFDAPRFMIDARSGGEVERIVREVPGGLARSPVSLPVPPGDDRFLPDPFGLDVGGIPDRFRRTDAFHAARWTIAPNGGVGSRGWIVVRFEAPGAGTIDVRSPLIRAIPSVEDAVGLLRDDLGPRATVEERAVHGHTAIGARSHDHPGRSMLFWYCSTNRRSYVIDRISGTTADVPYPDDLATCVHPDDPPRRPSAD